MLLKVHILIFESNLHLNSWISIVHLFSQSCWATLIVSNARFQPQATPKGWWRRSRERGPSFPQSRQPGTPRNAGTPLLTLDFITSLSFQFMTKIISFSVLRNWPLLWSYSHMSKSLRTPYIFCCSRSYLRFKRSVRRSHPDTDEADLISICGVFGQWKYLSGELGFICFLLLREYNFNTCLYSLEWHGFRHPDIFRIAFEFSASKRSVYSLW